MRISPLFFLLFIFPSISFAQIKLKKADTDKKSAFSIPFGENNAVSVPFSYINNVNSLPQHTYYVTKVRGNIIFYSTIVDFEIQSP